MFLRFYIFAISNFAISNFAISNFAISNFAISNFAISNFGILGFWHFAILGSWILDPGSGSGSGGPRSWIWGSRPPIWGPRGVITPLRGSILTLFTSYSVSYRNNLFAGTTNNVLLYVLAQSIFECIYDKT
jgi:hypothetical protein